MITAFVQFRLPQPITVDKAKEIFSSTAPKYREVQGLIRKDHLLSEDGLYSRRSLSVAFAMKRSNSIPMIGGGSSWRSMEMEPNPHCNISAVP